MKRLIVIEGPTASGKTALSVAVAGHFKTIVLSADSRQFYKEMTIGTAKPSKEELKGIPHYFIDSHSITDELTASSFALEARALLHKAFETHPVIVLTGGSGMYVDALCKGLDDVPVSAEEREKLNREFEMKGIHPLLEELEKKDPIHFSKIDKFNPMRVIRALEVIRFTGKPFSSFLKNQTTQNEFEVIRFRIEHPREQLYNRIDLRVDEMMKAGLLEEVKTLLPFRETNVLKTVGYRELFDYLDGETDLEEAVHLIKQHTRNYAKRQLTWLRKNPDSTIIPYTSTDEMCRSILSELEHREIQ